jgi:predicted deacylase
MKMKVEDFDLTQMARGRKQTGWLEISARADGGSWRLPLLTVTGAEEGSTLLVTAAVHGDEYEGVEAIPHIFQRIEPELLRGTLLMVPISNVAAYEAATRSSPVDGLNLARVFPGDQQGAITQRIAYWITEKLLSQADFFIDLHSGGVAYELPTLIGYIHDEGDLGQRSLAAARAFGAPVLWGHPLPLPPGRSISAATDLGVPSLYTEARGGGYADPDDVACFADGVCNVMQHLGMIENAPGPRPMSHHLFGDGNLDVVTAAPVAGFFRAAVNLLQEVEPGQLLGTICDPFGRPQAEVQADIAGTVIMLRRIHRVHVGDGLVHVTSTAPLQ